MPILDRSLDKPPGATLDLIRHHEALAVFENEPDAIKRMLASVREHMGMEVAYISEFLTDAAGDAVVFRGVDAPGFERVLAIGDRKERTATYCHHVMNGSLPGLMTDTSLYPHTQSIAITHSLPIRAHIGAPICLPDGNVYGMLCCISPHPDPSLTGRDMQVMKVFADIAAYHISRYLRIKTDLSDASVRIERVIEHNEFDIAYQPILTLAPLRLVGFEALCRFAPEPYRPPDHWFREAASVGLGAELELAAVRMALRAFGVIPDDLFIAVNVSPEAVLNRAFLDQFSDYSKGRLVVEITEHTKVDDYGALLAALAPLRAAGARLSVDDAGAGFASLQHILNLSPDIVKLDVELTKAIDSDPARRALATALVYFAKVTHSKIIAEGVETEAELAALTLLGIPMGQGYLLGRPANVASSKLLSESAVMASAV